MKYNLSFACQFLLRASMCMPGLMLGFMPGFVPGVAFAQGVSAPWDISQTASSLAVQAERLAPVVGQLKPADWQAKGAPGTYVFQAESIQAESGYLIGAAKAFEKQPEKLTLAIETYFRMQAVEAQVHSLADGVRKYQDVSLGDELISVVAANYANRDQLRQYIADLAMTREQEFKVIDSEAQRCRGVMLRQQAPVVKQPAAKPVVTAPKPAASTQPAASPQPAAVPTQSIPTQPVGPKVPTNKK